MFNPPLLARKTRKKRDQGACFILKFRLSEEIFIQGRRSEKRARGADFVEGHQQNFNYVRIHTLEFRGLDPVHTGPDPYGHQTAMTLKFVIILQNLIKAYHRKSGKSKYDRKLTELDVETTWIRSCVNRVTVAFFLRQILTDHILSIASVITLDINTSQISSIDSATAGFIITN